MTSCRNAPRAEPGLRRSFAAPRAWPAVVAAVGLLVAACGGVRGSALAEVVPIDRGSARPEPLPDTSERIAARLATLSLASAEDDRIGAALDELRQAEGGASTLLLDDATHLYHASRGARDYKAWAEQALETSEIDPALQLRLRRYLESEPLSIAKRRMREDATLRYGQIFNRIASPAFNAVVGNPVGAIETGRAAILALLVASQAPELSTQQRQALREYKRFLEREPESPESRWVGAEVERLEGRLRRARIQDALAIAEGALAAGRPDASLLHLARARRIDPDDPATQRLTLAAAQRQRDSDQLILRSLRAGPIEERSFRATAGLPGDSLAGQVLASPLSALPDLTVSWSQDASDMGLEDELEFLAAAGRMRSGDEDGYFEALGDLARGDPSRTNMGRHALPIITSGNPYAAYQRAQQVVRRRTAAFFFLGSFSNRRDRDLALPLVPLAALVELPSFVIEIATTPLRVTQIGPTRARISGPVLDAGEEYLSRFPEGEHAREVHRDLEQRYASREQWSQALVHHQALPDPDPDQIADYRGKIAERTLEAARLPRRADIRVSLYRTLIEEYGDTQAGRKAASELEELRTSITPQSIRISKKFLLEHRSITEPGALGLRSELLDGDDDNGELSEEGVRLIGRTYVRILLEGREPYEVELPESSFARFIARLEQAYELGLRVDPRARPIPDPQRDQFFERARLGLLDQADFRLAAASSFEFLSRTERYGPGRGRESILPVELVVRGGLEDFGVAALPRVKMPRESDDAILYK